MCAQIFVSNRYEPSLLFVFFFFKKKTAYERRISDWSSDVCSSDLALGACRPPGDGSWLQGSQRFPGGRRRSAASLRSHRRLDGPGASAPAAGCTAKAEKLGPAGRLARIIGAGCRRAGVHAVWRSLVRLAASHPSPSLLAGNPDADADGGGLGRRPHPLAWQRHEHPDEPLLPRLRSRLLPCRRLLPRRRRAAQAQGNWQGARHPAGAAAPERPHHGLGKAELICSARWTWTPRAFDRRRGVTRECDARMPPRRPMSPRSAGGRIATMLRSLASVSVVSTLSPS